MRPTLPAALALLALALPRTADAQIIRTIAGGMPDDLPAISSNIYRPTGTVVDAAGNLYIASGVQERIFKVDPQGRLTVFAGSGLRGNGPDTVPARQAMFFGLHHLAIDGAGNIYAMATGGTDEQGRGGSVRIDRIDATTGLLTNLVKLPGNFGGFYDLGRVPGGLAIDGAGNIYFSQWMPGRIHRWDVSTHALTVLAGAGSNPGEGVPASQTQVCEPADVALDAAGRVHYVDGCLAYRVRRIETGGTAVYTVAGGGSLLTENVPALAATLGIPDAITFDAAGDLIISDSFNDRVRRVDQATGLITTIAGRGDSGFSGDGGPALEAQFSVTAGVAVDAPGNLYVADWLNHRIRRIDAATGIITTFAGNGNAGANGDGEPAIEASLYYPNDIESDRSGNLIVSDDGNAAIRVLDRASGLMRTLAVLSTATSHRPPAGQIALDKQGNIYIADGTLDPDQATHRVRKVDASTGQITVVVGGGNDQDGDGMLATEVFIHLPSGVAVDSAGNIFVAQYYHNRIRRVDAETGIITTIAGDPQHPAFGGDGGPARQAYLNHPTHLAVDATGNLFIRDSGNVRIRRIDSATGIITTFAGGGSNPAEGIPATESGVYSVGDIATDAAGDVYLVEGLRIRRVDVSTGIITTVAGNGSFGSTGDGGPPLDAALAPAGIAVNPFGSVVLAETGLGRIRHVSQCTSPDVEPPSLTIAATPKVLRQTNHKMVPITITPAASDDCSRPLVKLVSITSSEPDDAPGNGDGKTVDDIQGAEIGTDDFEFLLRAERLREGGGRVYSVTYSAEDEAGHVTIARVNILVSKESRLVTAPAR